MKVKKALVAYRSASGYTEKYARWIASEIGADLRDARGLKARDLENYDLVVFGGALHAAGITGLRRFRAALARAPGRTALFFATGASPAKAGIVEELARGNFPGAELPGLELHYLRGGFDYAKLDPMNKVLMRLFRRRIEARRRRGAELSGDERGMLAAFETPVDFTRRESIGPLVARARAGL